MFFLFEFVANHLLNCLSCIRFFQVRPDDPKLENHPMLTKPNWMSRASPLVIHGDKCPFTKHGKLYCVSWSCLLSEGDTWQDTFLIWAVPCDCACIPALHDGADTWYVLWKWASHSFNQFFYGELLPRDPFGLEWDKVILIQWRLGWLDPLDPFGIVWIFAQDLEHAANDIGFPHFNSNSPCWFCRANRSNCSVRDVGPNACWKRCIFPHQEGLIF